MVEEVSKSVMRIVAQYGPALCRDPVRCEAVLRDLLPGNRREVAVLMVALRHRVCEDLLKPTPGLSREELFRKLSDRLYEDAAIDRAWAEWGVLAWASALGATGAGAAPVCPDESVAKKVRTSSRARRRASVDPVHVKRSTVVAADGTGQYRRIGDALAHSKPGARIYVKPGRYGEQLEIPGNVEIIGAGRPEDVILALPEAAALAILGSAYLHGITVVRTGAGELPPFALEMLRGSPVLEDCTVRSSASGILARGARTMPQLRRCTIECAGPEGFRCDAKSKPVLENSTIRGATTGVVVRGGASPRLKECVITGSHLGLDFGERAKGIVENSKIAGAAYAGISIHGQASPTFLHCLTEKGQIGFEVHDHGRPLLEACEVQGSDEGIRIVSGGNPVLRRCRIHHCRFGVRVLGKGRGTIEEAVISDNEYSGVSIKEGGAPAIRRCTITANGDAGIWVHKNGFGVIEGNDLGGNRRGPMHIENGSRVRARANRGLD